MENAYCVFFDGRLPQCPVSPEARQKMQRVLGPGSAALLEQIDKGRPLIIRDALPREDAQAIARLLTRHGLPCTVQAPDQEAGPARVFFTGQLPPGPMPAVTREKLVALLGPLNAPRLADLKGGKEMLLAEVQSSTHGILLARLLTQYGLPCLVYAGTSGIVWQAKSTAKPIAVIAPRPQPELDTRVAGWFFLAIGMLGFPVFFLHDIGEGWGGKDVSPVGLIMIGFGFVTYFTLNGLSGKSIGFFSVIGAFLKAIFQVLLFFNDEDIDISDDDEDKPLVASAAAHDLKQYQLIYTGRVSDQVMTTDDRIKIGLLLESLDYDLESVLTSQDFVVLKEELSPADVLSLRQSLNKLGVQCEMLPQE